MTPGRFLVGTSGWSYASWRGDFYPGDLRQQDQLQHLSTHTTATEVNASFYRLQRPSAYRSWREQTPADHVFAVKGSRYVTHLKQLRDPVPAVANLLASGLLELDTKLDVVLWQLPARMRFREPLLREFLTALPRTLGDAAELAAGHDDRIGGDQVSLSTRSPDHRLRHTLEPRHASFDDDEALALLRDHDVAMVHSDSAGTWPVLDHDTATFRYVRLHGHSELYASRYSDRLLDEWAERCRTWSERGQDVHVYFDNDSRGHAPHDAVRLLQRLQG